MTSPAQPSRDSIVDSHHHFWDVAKFSYAWIPPEDHILNRNYLPQDMLPLLQSTGVNQTVVVEAAQNSLEEADFLLGLAETNPSVTGVVAWVDLVNPEVGQVLDRLVAHPKLRGIRHGVEFETNDEWLLRRDVLRGLREVAQRGLTYDLLIRPRHLKIIPALVREVPHLRMVVDHIAKPPIASGEMEPWATDIATVAVIPGIYCKVSGMVTEADLANWTVGNLRPYVQHVVKVFGFDRIMWGSDWPVCLRAASYKRVLEAALEAVGPMTPEQRAAFLGGNATTFYGLG